jgi:hypothetical protein
MFNMAKKFVMVPVVLIAVLAFGAYFVPNASAYGQCGGEVSNGDQLYKAWEVKGVTHQAAEVVKSAGFHRMDGGLHKWMHQRVIKARLAKAASPEDFGCHPGELFSVGNRTLPKGTWVMVALPPNLEKSDVSSTPRKGFKRTKVCSVSFVGKVDCSNPERGKACVIFYEREFRKHVSRQKGVLRIRKVTKDASGNRIATPTGTFRFRLKVRGSSKTVLLKRNPQSLGHFSRGTKVTVTEIAPKGAGWSDWKVVSAKRQTIRIRGRITTLVFVNREKGTHHQEKEGVNICSGNTVGNGDVCGGTCNSTTIIVGSGNTVNNDVNCKTEEHPSCNCHTTPPPEEHHPCGCEETPPPEGCTGTPEECHPKNGESGAGENSGGPGNGCDAGYSWNGTECVVTNPEQVEEPGEGDGSVCRNPDTGDIEPGKSDQFGYCTS